MFPFSRVPFWVPIFDPQPYGHVMECFGLGHAGKKPPSFVQIAQRLLSGRLCISDSDAGL